MKNTIILTVSRFYEKGIMFLFFIFLAQKFGKESFGEFSYYFTIASILFVIFDLGGEFYQIREFSRRESLKIFQNVFVLKTFIATIVVLVALLSKQNPYLLILIISFYLDSVISLFRSSLYKNGLYLQESILTGAEKTAFIGLVSFNILSLKDIVWMYLAFIIGKFVYLFLALKKFYKLKYLAASLRLLEVDFIKVYLLKSWSYVLHALLVIIFVQIDIVMLKHLGIPYDDIGLYSSAVKIYFTIVILGDILFKQYYPRVASYIQKNELESLEKFILKVQAININASFFLSFLTMLFAHEIITIAFGSAFSEAGRMLVLLSVLIVFRFSMYTYTALLSSSSLNHIKLITSLTCVVINVALNIILIPRYGVYGALSATMVTEFVLVAMYKISSFKIVFTNYLTAKECIVLACIFASGCIFYLYPISIQYKISIAAVLGFFLCVSKKRIKIALSF